METVTIADELRQAYEQNQKAKELQLDIPSFGGKLVGVYRPLTEGEMRKLAKKVEKMAPGDQRVAAALDQVIESCVGLYSRDDEGRLVRPDSGEVVELPVQDNDTSPIRYNNGLVELLGLGETPTAREIVRKVFRSGGKFNISALLGHTNEIGEWMQNIAPDLAEEYEGE